MKTKMMLLILLPFMALGGCATVPLGPSVQVMPGPGKSFEQFQVDDAACRQWAGQQVGQSPQEAMNQSMGTGAAVGTAAGAVLGAVIGSGSGHAGSGAAVGAGTGLLLGSAVGANAGQGYGMDAQRRYDIAYQQCMYAKGELVPGVAPAPAARVAEAAPPPPPPPPPPPVAVAPGPPQVFFQVPPRFIYSPHLGFYVGVETPYDIVYIDGQYYLSSNGFWYASPYYNGPWVVVKAGGIPRPLGRFRHEEIHRYRDSAYGEYLHDPRHYRGRWHEPLERR